MMRQKDRKLVIFSVINCCVLIVLFLKSGLFYQTSEIVIPEPSLDTKLSTTSETIVVEATKQTEAQHFTGDVIANDLYQKYLGKLIFSFFILIFLS